MVQSAEGFSRVCTCFRSKIRSCFPLFVPFLVKFGTKSGKSFERQSSVKALSKRAAN